MAVTDTRWLVEPAQGLEVQHGRHLRRHPRRHVWRRGGQLGPRGASHEPLQPPVSNRNPAETLHNAFAVDSVHVGACCVLPADGPRLTLRNSSRASSARTKRRRRSRRSLAVHHRIRSQYNLLFPPSVSLRLHTSISARRGSGSKLFNARSVRWSACYLTSGRRAEPRVVPHLYTWYKWRAGADHATVTSGRGRDVCAS
jgi:hypothetical protein